MLKIKSKHMRNLLNDISWHIYLETSGTLIIIYYAYISWKYYRFRFEALYRRFTGTADNTDNLPGVLQYQEDQAETGISEITKQGFANEQSLKQESFNEGAKVLAETLRAAIEMKSFDAYNLNELRSLITNILKDFPEVGYTPDRKRINAFIILLCEKTGVALLSEMEVDQWWTA